MPNDVLSSKATPAADANAGILLIGTEPSMLFKFHGPLIKKLTESGFRVSLAGNELTSHPVYAPKLRALGAELYDAPVARTSINPFLDIATCFSYWRIMRLSRVNFVFGYTAKPVIWGTLAAHLSGVPHKIALITGLGYAFTSSSTGRRRMLKAVLVRLYRFALRRADLILFQNLDDMAEFQAAGVIAERSNARVVNGCGVNLQDFPRQLQPELPMTFIMVARLVRDKGVKEYAAAAKRRRQDGSASRFLLVGDLDANPDSLTREELDELQAAGVLDYKGHVEDVRPFLAESHVFVLPSFREGLPQSTLEALATGRAIITTDVPGCRETVKHGYNGYLVEARNSDSLSEAMKLCELTPQIVERMGMESRGLAEDRFDGRIISGQIVAYIRALEIGGEDS